jgi:hypothetical protein
MKKHFEVNCIGGVMVSVLASRAVDRGFEPLSGQTKDYKFCICCFSAKHAAIRRKSKDWLARNQNNVSEWSDMSTRALLCQCWSNTKRTSSSSHWILTCSRHDIAEKIADLALKSTHSLTHSLTHSFWGYIFFMQIPRTTDLRNWTEPGLIY